MTIADNFQLQKPKLEGERTEKNKQRAFLTLAVAGQGLRRRRNMVWGLFPVDPLPGEETYYIFAKGTYKVGRKGCDVIINKDKGVSRVHAEILVDAMISMNSFQNKYSSASSRVRIRDCSKYGTFVKKSSGSKEKVHELPNKETTLKDGDLVSFGTGNATYRFCFVPIILLVYCQEIGQMNNHLQDTIALIGASTTHDLSSECTHVIVDQFMPVNEDLIDAIVSKKPIALSSWLEILTEKNIRTEIPSCSPYAPALTMEGVSVRLADAENREKCLEGYKFLMDSTNLYKFRDRLQSLLEMVGAMVLSIDGFCSSSQGSDDKKKNTVVCVVPEASSAKVGRLNKLSSLPTVKEADLVGAVLSGHLDPSIFISPPVAVHISSSCSTDETVVADSDEEIETVTSNHATGVVKIKEDAKFGNRIESISDQAGTNSIENIYITISQDKNDGKMDKLGHVPENEKKRIMDFQDRKVGKVEKIEESENVDVIYSQNLIVRNINFPSTYMPTMNNGVPNFKNFRKIHTESGNSFSNLCPYSKYPYRDSDCGNEEIVESIKEEKKRKQMEAVAEDLFNNEKGRRRGASGSIHNLLTRG